jgi:hypothetical protein
MERELLLMVDEDLELERDLGQATIAYEDPDEGTVEKIVPNEHIAYFQDHWIVKTEEDDRGHDVVRRLPARRVHYVERSVEEFEEEVRTLRHQIESFAEDLRTKIPIGGGRSGDGRNGDGHHIDVEGGQPDEREPDGGGRAVEAGTADDPRTTEDEPAEGVDTSASKVADETGEAVDPEPEQAEPVQTEGTEPERTPKADVADGTNAGGSETEEGASGDEGEDEDEDER